MFVLRTIDQDADAQHAVDEGAMAVLSDHQVGSLPCIIVQDPIRPVVEACKELYRRCGRQPATLVTGSVGKTTTKYFVASAIESQYRTYWNPTNANIYETLVKEIQCIDRKVQRYVREEDESCPRSTLLASETLSPKVVIITNMDKSHIGILGSMDQIIRQITNSTRFIAPDGTVVINGDDEQSTKYPFECKIVRCAIQNQEAEYRASNIVQENGHTCFDLSFEERTVRVSIPILGEHNVYSAMFAFAAAKLNGVDERNILRGLSNYRSMGYRQNMMRFSRGWILADCYNASAKSIKAAIAVVDSMRSKKKLQCIAVLGDIMEIEGTEEEVYCEIGRSVDSSQLDVLITFGKDSKRIHDYVKKTSIQLYHASNRNELHSLIQKNLASNNNLLLFKGSNAMHLEKTIGAMFPLAFFKGMLPFWRRTFMSMIREI